MALTCRDKVGVLIYQLGKPDDMAEAKEALRGLIDRIVLAPNVTTGKLDIKIEGALTAPAIPCAGVQAQKWPEYGYSSL